MKPVFRIVADGRDISAQVNDRVLELVVTDKHGLESDTLSLTLDDRAGTVVLPRRGAQLELYLGYDETGVAPMGRYTVDTVTFSGAPDTLVIKAKSGDSRNAGKSVRSDSWENVTLAEVVARIAERNGWKAECEVRTRIARADQINESDYHFITRLARQYDCTAKIADLKLLVMPRQAGRSASGQALDNVRLMRGDVSSFTFTLDDRKVVAKVVVPFQGPDGTLRTVTAANPNAPKKVLAEYVERHVQANETAAQQLAKSRLADFNRQTAGVRLQLPGRADLFAECLVELSGFKTGVDGVYLVDTVTQHYQASGWTTSVLCNGGSDGKAMAGEGG
ncbi:phage late control D family protein [Pseudomonas sp. BGr12]|uniref:phage late control D family protein n=1 Tax=unclassified Pseudomonas TaxID=196821 RepID=UPI00177D7DCC|nr:MULTISPECIES: contractile injection system protein, VgrG/Pvc8 family [unclassified Pseudomonas]MBD9579532.1 late control protein [Pseudomonas sp. PDM23]MBD9674785.1 late control protein [Pseudomonas sp. PDM21]MDL2431303.1 contractile injection system protein, VgrG/Pvc8 family [Pseudomonas sp. BJa5]